MNRNFSLRLDMKLDYLFKAYDGNKLLRLVISLYLLTIFGMGIVVSAGYSFDTGDDAPVLALQSAAVIYGNDEVRFIKFIDESISLPSINSLSLPTRAPPA